MGRNATQQDSRTVVKHGGRFLPVKDSRKRKIRGLWMRNGRFYAQMRVNQGNGTTKPVRVPLKASSLDEAKVELEDQRTQNRKGVMHQPGHRPKFEMLALDYQRSADFLAKKEGTRQNETQALNRWGKHVGGIRVDWITTKHMVEFRDQRRSSGVTSRTVNLDVVAFNNAMAYAAEKKFVTVVPRLKKLKEDKAAKRPELSRAGVEKLLKGCVLKITKNAALLRFYLRFLAFTGAREQEALLTRKAGLDFPGRKVTIGADGDTKNRKFRTVDMTDELFEMLKELSSFLPEDTSFLFPSPQRGRKDIPAGSLRESFRLVRAAVGMEWVGFHDFRHFFASQCVMAGIDFMTIAEWLGHSDGGILVGQTYGHLNDQHKKRMASGLSLLGNSGDAAAKPRTKRKASANNL